MQILLITDEVWLGTLIPRLFDAIAQVQVFPTSQLTYALGLTATINIIIFGVQKPTDSDWEFFQVIKGISKSCYLMLGREVIPEDYNRAQTLGFVGILMDPLLTMKGTVKEAREVLKLLELSANTNVSDKILNSELIYIGQGVYFNTKELWVGSERQKTPLSEREVDLLSLFIRYEGKVLTKTIIAKALWNDQVDLGGISKLVKRLREKIGVEDLIIGRKQGGYIYKRTS